MRRFLVWLFGASVALTVFPGCGGSSARASAACQPAFQEKLDSRSTEHLFPGAPEPKYLTEPPTSGPHQLGPPFTGVVTTPIPRPKQVAMLESGYVLVQYQGLAAAQVGQLAALAGNLVTVAPAAATMPAPVVATAWTWKLTCPATVAANLQSIQAFIAAHKGQGFTQ